MRRKRSANHNRRLCMGSISHGTMRTEDLIPAFVDHFDSLINRTKTDRKIVAEIKRAMRKKDYYESSEAGHDLDHLFEILNGYAPDYFYFGANAGDGADYGYWLSDTALEQFSDYDGLKVNDTSEVPKGYTGEVLHVNDHGNVSLYRAVRGRLYEVWSVV